MNTIDKMTNLLDMDNDDIDRLSELGYQAAESQMLRSMYGTNAGVPMMLAAASVLEQSGHTQIADGLKVAAMHAVECDKAIACASYYMEHYAPHEVCTIETNALSAALMSIAGQSSAFRDLAGELAFDGLHAIDAAESLYVSIVRDCMASDADMPLATVILDTIADGGIVFGVDVTEETDATDHE